MAEETRTGTLFIFAGLPGSGKSELARYLSRQFDALYLRIDTIEQSLRDMGLAEIGPQGYVIAYNVAADNLRLGRNVIADSVNPLQLTRNAWRDVARAVDARFYEIEVVCSDEDEHRRRIETRKSEVPGLQLPTWQAVVEREYERWDREHIVIDTAGQTTAESKQRLLQALPASGIEIE